MMLVLIEQHELINDNGAQRQQLRAPQALHRHLGTPLKHIFEQTIERFNRLRSQLMEDAPDEDVSQVLIPDQRGRPNS